MSPLVRHNTVIHPKECATTIIVQVDREVARIKERNYHWEDGIEVRLDLLQSYCFSPLL